MCRLDEELSWNDQYWGDLFSMVDNLTDEEITSFIYSISPWMSVKDKGGNCRWRMIRRAHCIIKGY